MQNVNPFLYKTQNFEIEICHKETPLLEITIGEIIWQTTQYLVFHRPKTMLMLTKVKMWCFAQFGTICTK